MKNVTQSTNICKNRLQKRDFLIKILSMKKYFFLFVSILIITKIKAQTDTIMYILPDKVEVCASNYLENCLTRNSTYYFYFHLSIKNDNYTIAIIPYLKGNNIVEWVNKTNRKLVVGKILYPIIFDYDVLFSTTCNSNIGISGKREGFIKRVYINNEGSYDIIFNKKGEIIKYGYKN